MKKFLRFSIASILFVSSVSAQDLYRDWTVYQDGNVHADDRSLTSVNTASNEVYTLLGERFDFTNPSLVKQDAQGKFLWTDHLSVFKGQSLNAGALTVDQNGNALVGVNIAETNGYDIGLAKFSTSGSVLWSTRINLNFQEKVNVLACDSLGNVYLSGYTDQYPLIMKYDSNGLKQWTKIDTLGENVGGVGYRMIVKGTNIFLEGTYNYNGGFVAKYSTLTGKRQWQYTLNGIVGNFDETYKSRRIALDSKGNLVWAYYTSIFNTAEITKIDQSGNRIWEVDYKGPAGGKYALPCGVSVDDKDNIYLLSALQGQTTVSKFLPDGSKSWFYTYTGGYNGSSGNPDQVKALILNGSKSIYASTRIFVVNKWKDLVLRLDTSGNFKWTASMPFPLTAYENVVSSILPRANSGLTTVGYTYQEDSLYNIRLCTYDSTSNRLANTVFGNIDHASDEAQVQLMDAKGFLHVGGYCPDTTKSVQVRFLTLDQSGSIQQEIRSSKLNKVRALELDSSYNTYAAGVIKNGALSLVKFSASGQFLWADTIPRGNILNSDHPPLFKVTPTGEVYFSCQEYGGSFDRILIIKYSPTGQRLWVKRFIPSTGHAWPLDLALSSDEHVYICGSSYVGFDQGYDVTWLKYDKDGNLLHKVTKGKGLREEGTHLVIDEQQSSYMTSVDEYSIKVTTYKLDSAGNEIWKNEFDGCNDNRIDYASDIKLDKKGRCYITGATGDCAGGNRFDLFTIRYSATGTEDWKRIYTYPVDDLSTAGGTVDVDSAYNVLITYQGASSTGDTKTGINLVKYTTNGDFIGKGAFEEGLSSGTNYIRTLCTVTPNGHVFLSGYTNKGQPLSNDLFVARFLLCDMPVVSITAGKDSLCKGASTTLTAAPMGLASYKWSPATGLNKDSIYNPTAQPELTTVYTLIAKDSKGCQAIASKTLSVLNPSASLTSSNVRCFGAKDGRIEALAVGGKIPYSYAWSNGGKKALNDSLAPGTYSLVVTDALGCVSKSVQANITEPSAINLSITTQATTDGKNNGRATAIVSGGVTPYTYLWDDPQAQTTNAAKNLVAGTYTVIVTDKNLCSKTKSAVVEDKTTGIQELSETTLQNLFYNAEKNSIELNLQLTANGNCSFKLYSLEGKELVAVPAQHYAAGIHALSIPAGELASGMYFIGLTIDGQTGTKKVFINR